MLCAWSKLLLNPKCLLFNVQKRILNINSILIFTLRTQIKEKKIKKSYILQCHILYILHTNILHFKYTPIYITIILMLDLLRILTYCKVIY